MHRRCPGLVAALILLASPIGASPLWADDEPIVELRPAPEDEASPDRDLVGLAGRVLCAPDEDLEALARAVAALDLGAARVFVQRLRQRAGAPASTPRPWPPLAGPEGVAGDEPPVDPDTPLVDVEARVLEMTPACWREAVAGSVGSPGTSVVLLDGPQVERLLAASRRGEGVTQVTAPRLGTYSGQRAAISLLHQVSYVQDYDVTVAEDGSTVADPIVAVVNEGLALELRATLTPDRAFVTLEIAGTWSDLARPLQELTVALGQGTATVQVPQVGVRQLRSTVRLASGTHVLLVDERPWVRDGVEVVRALLLTAAPME